jgi:hypothetical protein
MPQRITFLPYTLDPLGTMLSRPAETLPPSATPRPMFTILGGRILLTLILGEVTTIIQALANATKLTFDPDAAGATQDLCATLDITGDVVGSIYRITGIPTVAMLDRLNFGEGMLIASPLILKPGKIILNCAATSSGATKWDAWYTSLDPGASMILT